MAHRPELHEPLLAFNNGKDGTKEDRARSKDDVANDTSGHRARVRQRLLNGDSEALLDHEVIEYLLALAIPRRDTKPLARRLVHQFGSAAAVLTADSRSLLSISGLGETSVAALKIAQVAALRLLAPPTDRPIISSHQALTEYLHADMAHLTFERVRVLYLNARNMLVSDEHMGDGSISEAAVHVREVIRRALDLGATAMILVHNHPSGVAEPSQADVELTRRIIEAGQRLDIQVHDHLVIGRDGYVSMRERGLI
jgi:DNA repair protein RadC